MHLPLQEAAQEPFTIIVVTPTADFIGRRKCHKASSTPLRISGDNGGGADLTT